MNNLDTMSKEFFCEMSDSRLLELINRRSTVHGFYYDDVDRNHAIQEVEQRKKNEWKTRNLAEIEFRQEVVDAIVNSGFTKRVAENMTIEASNLMQQAKKYGVI